MGWSPQLNVSNNNCVFGLSYINPDVLEFSIPNRIIRQISEVIISANTVNIYS